MVVHAAVTKLLSMHIIAIFMYLCILYSLLRRAAKSAWCALCSVIELYWAIIHVVVKHRVLGNELIYELESESLWPNEPHCCINCLPH